MLHVVERCLEAYGDVTPRLQIAAAFEGTSVQEPMKLAVARSLEPNRFGPAAQVLGVYFCASSLFFAGAAGISRWFGGGNAQAETSHEGLPLVPSEAGYLKAVVTPWAHVFVDGEHVATTPFAAPIVLPAGMHHVKFTHPEAVPEERQVQLAPGQTLHLDVAMQLHSRAHAESAFDLLAAPADAGLGP